jgi:hypothetical protein
MKPSRPDELTRLAATGCERRVRRLILLRPRRE